MAKSIECVVPGSAFRATTATEDRLLTQVAQHAREGRRLTEIDPDLVAKVEGSACARKRTTDDADAGAAERRTFADAGRRGAMAPSAIWKRADPSYRSSSTIEGLADASTATGASTAGRDKAIFVFSTNAHRVVEHKELGTDHSKPSTVEKNYTVTVETEDDVCLDDVYEVSDIMVRSVAATVAMPDAGAALGQADLPERRRTQQPPHMVPLRVRRPPGTSRPRCAHAGRSSPTSPVNGSPA